VCSFFEIPVWSFLSPCRFCFQVFFFFSLAPFFVMVTGFDEDIHPMPF